MNQFNCSGRLGRDPETRTVGDKTVVNFSIAVDDPFIKDKGLTLWQDCVAWEKQAEVITRFLTKGSWALLSGSLKVEKWKSKEGEERSKTVLRVEHVTLGPKADSPASTPSSKPAPAATSEVEDDLPF